jgi:hypothetical protein
LQRAVDGHDRGFEQDAVLFFGECAPDDNVDESGFVFERDEGDAFRGARMLAHGDEAGAAQRLIVPLGFGDEERGHDAALLQFSAQQCERMAFERQALRRVIGENVFLR